MKIGHVYKLVCKNVDATEVYVGSSTSLRNRRATHKSACHNQNDKSYNLPVYQYIRENGGWANWDLLPIERVEFDFKFELHERERHHMEALHATLNSCVPNRTAAEYYNENKVEICQRQKQHYQDHKQEKNQYYQDRKEKLNKKHDCPCGGRYTHHNKPRHMKTEHHMEFEAFMALTEEQVKAMLY